MRRPFSEFDPTKSRVLLWVVACLVLVMLVVYATWGCGPSEPSTGKAELEEVEVDETTGTVFSDEVLEEEISDDPIGDFSLIEEPDDD